MSKANLERIRWRVAAAAVLVQLCMGTVYAWSIFKKPLMTAHGWHETQTQAVFMISSAVFGLSVALGGALVDRKGPRPVGILGGTLFGAGLIMAGLANRQDNIFMLYLAYGLIAGMGGGIGYSVPVATLIRWFPDKRGLVTGLAVMGYGFGSFIMGNVGPRLIIAFGVEQVFYIWGCISLAVIVASMSTLTNPPAGWLPASFRHDDRSYASATQAGFTFPQALRTPQLWTLWLIFFLIASAGLGLISQLSPMAQDVMQQEIVGNPSDAVLQRIAIASGSVVAIAAVFNGLGRTVWAWISDAIGRKRVFMVMTLTQAIGYVLLAQISNVAAFTILACYLLACYGGTMSSMPAFVADEFGARHIGKIYGIVFTACSAAGLMGPYLLARMKEHFESFQLAIYILAGLLGLAFMLTLLFRSPRQDAQ